MPAGSTYEAIATQTLGSAAASVTFSSISSTYTDLMLVINGDAIGGNNNIVFRIGNGSVDTGSNYSFMGVFGYSTTAGSSRGSNATKGGFCGWGTNQSTVIYQFMNYSNTTTNKTILGRGADTAIVDARVTTWRSTVAINRIQIFMDNAENLKSGSTFSLYGIKAA
jgi:hypothetical protein